MKVADRFSMTLISQKRQEESPNTVASMEETSGDKAIYYSSAATVLVLALFSGLLSYDSLRKLALEAAIPYILAFLFPIIIDGLILSGSLLTLFFANKGRMSRYGTFLVVLGVVSSIAGNVSVSDNSLVSQLVHAASPIVLFLSLEAFTILLRWRFKNRSKLMLAENVVEEEPIMQESVIPTYVAPENTAVADKPRLEKAAHAVENRQITQEVTPIPAEEDAGLSSAPVVVNESESSDSDQEEVIQQWNEVEASLPVEDTTHTVAVNVPKEEKSNLPVAEPAREEEPLSVREKIQQLLASGITDVGEIADRIPGDRKYVRKLAREELSKLATV